MTLREKLQRANGIDNNVEALINAEKKKRKNPWYKPSPEDEELFEAALNMRMTTDYFHGLLRKQAQKGQT